jgi:hypothetical protein
MGDYAAPTQRITVEAIYGWRWPGGADGAALQQSVPDTAPPADGEDGAGAMDTDTADPAPPAPEAASTLQPKAEEGMDLSEADAVAALLAAADGEEAPPREEEREAEYFVKYVGRSHVHNEWVVESTLAQIARRKVANFKKRHGGAPCFMADPQWSVPEELVARRANPYGPGWQVLVKWRGLGWEHATWEVEGEQFLLRPEIQDLARQLWERQYAALQRSLPEALEAAQAARISARTSLQEIDATPECVAAGGELYPHQLAALNWLRRQWSEGNAAVFADEGGLGKNATVLAFLRTLRLDYGCAGPVLIVAPASGLTTWEGECARWLGPDVAVVTYHGSSAARAVLLDNAIWMAPASLDGRGVHRPIIADKVRGKLL